jgi:type I restriction enzyme R subunit
MTQSEHELESALIAQLKGMEYNVIRISKEADMRRNLKQQLEIHNQGIKLTDAEFERVLNHLNTGTVFERAKILRDKFALKRDNETVYLSFLNDEDWCMNEFQVAHQIRMEGNRKNRYDVTILINGLPLVQIELKKRGSELKVAFHQINRYQHESYDAGAALFQYVQIFIISNGVNTKYFANHQRQSFEQTFVWTDKDNNRLSDLHEFTAAFLKPCHIVKMITQYTVLKEADKVLMVLRPYQFYAVDALVNQVKNSTNNAYIWHTTGSGKTLTSYKASQIIKCLPKVDKVLFVVDRKDLDYQTAREFNAFYPDCVDNTTDTHKLVAQLRDKSRGLIVTTIQKLNNAIGNPRYFEKIRHLQDSKVVFIFDECHRSQFGETHQNIKRFFRQAQMFGFTGTPIFADNAAGSVGHQQTTASLFGECLHRYVIVDAIRDENVLRFSVEYVGDIEVEADSKEVIEHENRLEKIVDYILEHHQQKTKDQDFTAIFCVSSIAMLIRYYDLFKRKQANSDKPLKIAAIFSYAVNEEDLSADGSSNGLIPEESLDIPKGARINQSNRNKLEEYVADYNALFKSSFSINDSQSFYAYSQDIAKQVRRKEVDILLVVNMFLTGFDSPHLNTLYVDKNLKFHGLVQAFSRTNRILNEKKSQGNIVCFRNLKAATDEAIALFSDKDAKETVLVRPYQEYIQEFNRVTAELLATAPTVQSVDRLPSEVEQKEFVLQFRELLRIKNVLTTFSDFSADDLALPEQTFTDYRSKYLDLHEKVDKQKQSGEKSSALEDIDFELSLIHRDDINVAYILELLQKFKQDDSEDSEKQGKKIDDLLTGEMQLRSKRELFKKFINENLPKLKPAQVMKAFTKFWTVQKQKALDELCKEENLSPDKIQKLLNNYLFTNQLPRNEEIISALNFRPRALQRKPIRERVRDKIKTFIDTFIEGMGGVV